MRRRLLARPGLRLRLRLRLRLLAYRLSGLVPRSPTMWVFGNLYDAFESNSKYLFLAVTARRPDLTAVWITSSAAQRDALRAQGCRAELRRSWRGAWCLLRAGAYVYSAYPGDVGAALSRGALLVNLWHGSGLKNLAYGNAVSTLSRVTAGGDPLEWAGHLGQVLVPDVVVATSPAIATRFAEQFRVPVERCPVLGTPRLDPAVDAPLAQRARAFGSDDAWRAAREAHREVYVYMPTFRHGHPDFLAEALPDLARLSRVLADRDAVLFVKLHPKSRTALTWDLPNVRPWPAGTDFYLVMGEVDVLISDYSSVMFDFVRVSSRGLVLYPYDSEDYLAGRGLYFSYDESVAGLRVDDFGALCDAVADGRAAAETEPAALRRVLARFWEGSVHPAAAAVTAEVEARLRDRAVQPQLHGWPTGSLQQAAR